MISDQELIERLHARINTLEMRNKLLEESELRRFAGLTMQGYCTLGASTDDAGCRRMAELAVKQAKALIAELNKEGE